jgi:hypothetical protein
LSETFWQCGIFRYDFGTVLTVWYFSTRFWNCSDSIFHVICTRPGKWTVMYLCVRSICVCLSSRSYRKIPHCQNSSEIILENTTLSEQFRNHIGKYHTVRTVPKSCRKILELRQTPILLTHKYYKQFMISKLKQLCSPVICEKCHFTHIWK